MGVQEPALGKERTLDFLIWKMDSMTCTVLLDTNRL